MYPIIVEYGILANFIGFYEEECTFGVMKKGVYKPSSDFNFKFVSEVMCADPHSSGYMITVKSERSHATQSSKHTRCIHLQHVKLNHH